MPAYSNGIFPEYNKYFPVVLPAEVVGTFTGDVYSLLREPANAASFIKISSFIHTADEKKYLRKKDHDRAAYTYMECDPAVALHRVQRFQRVPHG